MNEVQTLNTYHETITTNAQLSKIHRELAAKNFKQIANGYWTEMWENLTTDETVIIVRKS